MLCRPLLLPPSIFPRIRVSSNESVLCIRWPKYWSFSISSFNEYSGMISLGLTGFIFFSQRGSKESSTETKFESINSFVLTFLYDPTLTSVHDYWKNHNLDYTGLCQQSNVSVFNTLSSFLTAIRPRITFILVF